MSAHLVKLNAMPVDQPDLPDPLILSECLECAPSPHPPHISRDGPYLP